jgi:CDP-diacylglycerol--serine O-phosphatidyltransferase
MQRVRNAIPNLLTLGNLACGLVAIILLLDRTRSFYFPHVSIGLLMIGAMAFDFADGFAARALKATSPIGKELDSLADLVSFGILPGLMVFTMLKTMVPFEWQVNLPIDYFWTGEKTWKATLFSYIGLLIPLVSALRLAKFNVDTRQSYGFLGLPTPANALFFLSIFLIWASDFTPKLQPMGPSPYETFQFLSMEAYMANPFAILYHPIVLIALTLIFSILLVTEIPLLAMKFKDYTWKGNWPRYALILISVTLLAILWIRAIPLIIVLYFLFSFIDTRIHKKA